MSAEIVDLTGERARRRPAAEPWLKKAQLAEHLGYSTRWIELRVKEGMPSEKWGGERRFRITAVEDWLRSHYHQRRAST